MNPKLWICSGALVGCLAVAAGAFGAHSMKDTRLEEVFYRGAEDKSEYVALMEYKRRMDIFETAVRYQMYHAIALVMTGLVGLAARDEQPISASVAGVAFVTGLVFFCGPLYGLVFLIGFNWLGAIAPVGGLALMLGWAALAVAGLSAMPREQPR